MGFASKTNLKSWNIIEKICKYSIIIYNNNAVMKMKKKVNYLFEKYGPQ